MIRFYQYKKCGTCRKAQKALDALGVKYEDIDITQTPPPKTVLKRAMAEVGMRKVFNTSGVEYKERKIKDKIASMTEAEALELLAGNGRLVKRPVTVDGDRVTIGFSEEEFLRTWRQ